MYENTINVEAIRKELATKYITNKVETDSHGNVVLPITAASFIADEKTIFAPVNEEYVQAEINWYESQSLNIGDIFKSKRVPPIAWIHAADPYGNINSNYGHLIRSKKYFEQYKQVVKELTKNPSSRRASMIYTRPSIWEEYNENKKADFICTNAVTYYLRPCDSEEDHHDTVELDCVVQMRSNDVVFGYRNDYAWQSYILDELCDEFVRCRRGNIYWQVQNLHVYEKHFHYIEDYISQNEYFNHLKLPTQ